MSSGKVSKNSTKGSKTSVVFKEKRIKPKKEYILVELTQEISETYKEDLSTYNNKPVEEIITRYGKTYLKIRNV
jgi:hypothetical protein